MPTEAIRSGEETEGFGSLPSQKSGLRIISETGVHLRDMDLASSRERHRDSLELQGVRKARRSGWRVLVLLSALALQSQASAYAKKYEPDPEALARLSTEHRRWLDDVFLLITDEETQVFLELDEEYQRKAFVERFWRQRDTYPDTARNEFRDRWYGKLEEARILFGGEPLDERMRVFMLNGPPSERVVPLCRSLWPFEAWIYGTGASDRKKSEFALIFYQFWGRGPFRIWIPMSGMQRIVKDGTLRTSAAELLRIVYNDCHDGQEIASIFNWVLQRDQIDFELIVQDLTIKPEGPSGEWVATFEAYSTDVEEDATPLPGRVEVEFTGRHQSRTLMEGRVILEREGAGLADLGGHRSYNFLVTGEILRDEELFESFRYKFDFPAIDVQGDEIPLVFQRRLRPGRFMLRLKVEDLNGGGLLGERIDLEVPGMGEIPLPDTTDPESVRLFEEATAALLAAQPTVRLVAHPQGIVTGFMRFDTLVSGKGIDEVVFLLDNKPILRKRNPPYSVELDLGNLPRNRVLRVEARNEDGDLLDDDEIVLNAGSHRFAVRIKEPRADKTYVKELTVEADIAVPEGRHLERVEIFLNETMLATLYQEPWVQRVELSEPGMVGYVRAVAYLPDGNSTEDTAFVNAGFAEDVEVDYVELYTTVVDRNSRPVHDLARSDFSIEEDGQEQVLLRFEALDDLPIHTVALLDVSASMEGRIDDARQAALGFFEETITPKDRAAVITFNDRPQLAVKMTSTLANLGGGLAGLKAERGTALYDAVIFSLYYFNGIKGQRALLLLSDGKDESSEFEFEDSLEYARRSGVAIYSIGLDLGKTEGDAKRKLKKLSSETGGESYFVEDASELAAVYARIERELRSRYLLTYQSTNTSRADTFRKVKVDVARSGLEAKTLRGYYP